jgi:GMP synthase (glutamine-hydrolysing)
MTEKILILDFGSQYTQLIARAVRESNVYCEIIPYHKKFDFEPGLKGIILSGSPCSVNEEDAPDVNVQDFITKVPVLGICYGAQLTAKRFGGRVEKVINVNMAERCCTNKKMMCCSITWPLNRRYG